MPRTATGEQQINLAATLANSPAEEAELAVVAELVAQAG
jgi:hypothetical protein